jgi:hypothetical protein
VRVAGDTQLEPLLESKHLEYDAVTESGMSEMIWMLAVPIGIGLLFVSWLTLGPVSYSERSRSPFLGPGQGLAGLTDKAYSERTQRRIDEEVTRLIEEAMARARDIVTHHRDALGKVAARLLQQETLEGDELRRILADAGAMPAEREGPGTAAEAELQAGD